MFRQIPLKRIPLTLEAKIDIINMPEKGSTNKDISICKNRSPSTISSVISNKEKLLRDWEVKNKNKDTSRSVETPFKSIEDRLIIFFKEIENSGLPINASILKSKALMIADELKITNFTGSDGWFTRFKRRNGISHKRIHGEANSSDHKSAEIWKNTELKDILEKFEPRNIYNFDESSFYYKILDQHTYVMDNKNVSGVKNDKTRVSVGFLVNMDGSDLQKPIIIGKVENHTCFKVVTKLPCYYQWNKTAWMTCSIFDDYFFELNNVFKFKNRFIVVIMDNASSHSKNLNLSNIDIRFLPKNTTPLIQPLDSGIISAVKREYSKELTANYLLNYILHKPNKVTLLEAMIWLTEIWKKVKTSTIINCFGKAGFKNNFTRNDDDNEDEELFLEPNYRVVLEEQIEEMNIPISSKVKSSLEASLKEFHESDRVEMTCKEWSIDQTSNIPLYRPSINDYICKESGNNGDYSNFMSEIKDKAIILEYIKDLQTYVISEGLPECGRQVHELFEIQ